MTGVVWYNGHMGEPGRRGGTVRFQERMAAMNFPSQPLILVYTYHLTLSPAHLSSPSP